MGEALKEREDISMLGRRFLLLKFWLFGLQAAIRGGFPGGLGGGLVGGGWCAATAFFANFFCFLRRDVAVLRVYM